MIGMKADVRTAIGPFRPSVNQKKEQDLSWILDLSEDEQDLLFATKSRSRRSFTQHTTSTTAGELPEYSSSKMMKLIRTVLLACIVAPAAGFLATPNVQSRMGGAQSSFSLASSTTATEFDIEIVKGEDRVLDVAAFRNGMTNPEMMVEKAKAKREAIDTKTDALKGLGIGLGIVGPVIGGATFFQTNDLAQAATNYGEWLWIRLS